MRRFSKCAAIRQSTVLIESDADHRRRVLVRLTLTGIAAMERFFDAVERD